MVEPSTVYELGACSTGCGEMVALRALPSRSMILYCTSCGCAYRTLRDFACEPPMSLAPVGIEFPEFREVETTYPGERISAHRFRQTDFWDLIAETHLAAGDPGPALSIAEQVIATWHVPPDRAFKIRERARRACAGPPDASA